MFAGSALIYVSFLVSLEQITAWKWLIQLFKGFSSATRECKNSCLSVLCFYVVTQTFAQFVYVFWHVTYLILCLINVLSSNTYLMLIYLSRMVTSFFEKKATWNKNLFPFFWVCASLAVWFKHCTGDGNPTERNLANVFLLMLLQIEWIL